MAEGICPAGLVADALRPKRLDYLNNQFECADWCHGNLSGAPFGDYISLKVAMSLDPEILGTSLQ
jgi:hypothetical protein